MIPSTSFIHCLCYCIVICCLQCKCTLSSVLLEENKSIAHTLRQKKTPKKPVQLPQEANEVNPFRAASSSSTNIARVSTRHSSHRQPATLSSTLYRSYVIIQTGLCSDLDCENIPTAQACHTYVQSQGGNFVFFEEVTSTRPSGCFTFGFTENQWHFNSAKPSTNIAKREGGNTGYRFVCDCRSSLLATSSRTKSTQDRLEMKSHGLTETRMVQNRRRLAACSSISTSGCNEWSASCSDTRFELAGVDSNNGATFLTKDDVVSQNESMSFDETPRLALLSTPPLEEEDERTTHVVLSFGSVVLRWNHSNCWKRRAGKLKSISSLSYYIFRRQSSHIT